MVKNRLTFQNLSRIKRTQCTNCTSMEIPCYSENIFSRCALCISRLKIFIIHRKHLAVLCEPVVSKIQNSYISITDNLPCFAHVQ
jgi:hypothetical protein